MSSKASTPNRRRTHAAIPVGSVFDGSRWLTYYYDRHGTVLLCPAEIPDPPDASPVRIGTHPSASEAHLTAQRILDRQKTCVSSDCRRYDPKRYLTAMIADAELHDRDCPEPVREGPVSRDEMVASFGCLHMP